MDVRQAIKKGDFIVTKVKHTTISKIYEDIFLEDAQTGERICILRGEQDE